MKETGTDISVLQTQLTSRQIYDYFTENEEIFKDSLFRRVNPLDYSDKISRNAVHFCAFAGKELAGLLACYFNHSEKEFGYITTISVSANHQNKGIAKRLMNSAIQYARKKKFKKIRLEVKGNNFPAVSMYKSLGFTLYESRNDDLFLELITGV